MVNSMTGYGRGEAVFGNGTVTAEVRSVNNRYLDCSVRLPRAYTFAEDSIKSMVQGATTRGKVDVFITLNEGADEGVEVLVDEELAGKYVAALRTLRDRFELADDITASAVARFPDVLKTEKAAVDVDRVKEQLGNAMKLALADYNAMREREGAHIAEDLLSKLAAMEEYVTKVETRSPGILADYSARLRKKMEEVLADRSIDEARLLTEVAVFADKIAVDEETVRLRSHIAQFRGMLENGGPVGRKLDFLVQEMNRETNTIGSKCSDLECSGYVVDMKAEIEKIREQIQNLE